MCKGAKADVVFLIDGSWSIGEESFTKVVHFVYSMIGAFDVIGPSGMQVCIKNTDPIAKQQCALTSCCSCFVFMYTMKNILVKDSYKAQLMCRGGRDQVAH